MSAKAGLEHRNYPYDLKRLKLTTLGMIPSLIPSVPIGDNRTPIDGSHFNQFIVHLTTLINKFLYNRVT